jgi:CheY-like chemotaxis protein
MDANGRRVARSRAHEENLAGPLGGETPAIAVTAYGRPQDRLRARAAGFGIHVAKPVDPGELTAIISGAASQMKRPRVS